MKAVPWSQAALQLRLQWHRTAAMTIAPWLLVLAGGVAWLWLLATPPVQDSTANAQHKTAPAKTVTAPPSTDQNISNFYALLGALRDTDQQVKTLFRLAEKNGLTLAKGQYKAGLDASGQFHTYQIELPVTGSYHAIWQFVSQALTAIPFASLDDISFKRDAVADSQPQARLRFILYLRAAAGTARP